MREDRKKTLLVGIAAVFVVAAVSTPFWFNTAEAKQDAVFAPIPLGTNRLKIGARLYNPRRTNELLFTVVDIDTDHQFPDGEVREGVQVRGPNSTIRSWIPRENMRDVLVVQ